MLRKWRACDVGEAEEGLENEMWRRWSNGRVGEWAVTYVKRRKGWRMRCDMCEVNEKVGEWALLILQPFRHFTYVRAHSPTLPSLYLRHSSFSNPSVASLTSHLILQSLFRFSYVTGSSLTSQLILQPFRRFTYITAHSPTLPLLHLRHSTFPTLLSLL